MVIAWIFFAVLLPLALPVILAHDFGEYDGYYDGYAWVDMQEEMLKDDGRSGAYRQAIMQNAEADFKGAIVIDVGCGTGILSLFAAKAGAKKVYCIEASKILADTTAQVIEANGYGDVVEVVNKVAEEVSLPHKADVIVSEWMGYFLFFENMLSAVLKVRDRWLKPGGRMYPSTATLHMAAYSDSRYYKQAHDYWSDVHGFDFSLFQKLKVIQNQGAPMRMHLRAGGLIAATDTTLASIDIGTVTEADLQVFSASHSLRAPATGQVHGAAFWFDVAFAGWGVPHTLTTHPRIGYNCWGHMVWWTEAPHEIQEGQAGSISVEMRRRKSGSFDLALNLSWTSLDGGEETSTELSAAKQDPSTVIQDVFERLHAERWFGRWQQEQVQAPAFSHRSAQAAGKADRWEL